MNIIAFTGYHIAVNQQRWHTYICIHGIQWKFWFSLTLTEIFLLLLLLLHLFCIFNTYYVHSILSQCNLLQKSFCLIILYVIMISKLRLSKIELSLANSMLDKITCEIYIENFILYVVYCLSGLVWFGLYVVYNIYKWISENEYGTSLHMFFKVQHFDTFFE